MLNRNEHSKMNIFIPGVFVAIVTLTLFLREASAQTYIQVSRATNVCPFQAFNSTLKLNGCNKQLGKLQEYMEDLRSSGNQGCTFHCTCTVSFSYNFYHYDWKKYDIYQTTVRADYKTTSFSKTYDARCQNNGNTRTTLYINCDLKNCKENIFHDICIPGTDCLDTTKKCYPDHGNNLGVCVCKDNYIGIGSRCLIGNLSLGQKCERNEQCSSLTNSQCRLGECVCRAGFMPFQSSECIPEKVYVGGSCHWDQQCSGSSESGLCTESRCVCREGYISFNQNCYPGNTFHDICKPGSDCLDATKKCYPDNGNSLGVCVCKDNYIGIGNRCLIGNLSLGQECERNEQCSAFTNSQCRSGECSCREGYKSFHNSECIPETVFVGGSCYWDEQCTGSSESGLCRVSRCACKEGYISLNQNCYPGNSTLNQTCEIQEQCSTVQNSICENGTCVCRDGYTIVNSTHCQQEENIESMQRDYLLQKSSYGIGMTLGAICGGFLFGVLISVLAVYVIYRRCVPGLRKREEPGVAFVGDVVCGTNSAVEIIQDETSVNQGKQRKVVNVPPYAPSFESPTYSNVQKAGKSRLKNDDIYNHLNEKEENPENNDNYNIAPGTSRLAVAEGDYSHLNAERRNERIILSQDDEYACAEESTSDNYFKLEKQ